MTKDVKLIFDADALIKIVKAGLSKQALIKIKANISEVVYNEAVIEGKKRLYKDADTIETLIKEKCLHKITHRQDKNAQKMMEAKHFGKGEISSLHLYFNTKADAIVSDDKAFLRFLKQNGIPFIIPVDMVANLYKKGNLSKKDALNVLNKLKVFIDEEDYSKVKIRLEDEK